MNFDLTALSFGAGVQSSALLVMSALGLRDCPRADAAIFADTQAEPAFVYDHLSIMSEWASRYGIPINVVTQGNLETDIINGQVKGIGRFASIPLWTRGDDGRASPIRRQCTAEYKLQPIQREIRRLLGYEKGRRVKKTCRALIGISMDECVRCRPSRAPWITNCYPLVDNCITREGCEGLLREVGLPIPQKSACRFCPYHDGAYWIDLRDNHPGEFERACGFDDAIRNSRAAGVERPVFVHRSLQPLRDVVFERRVKTAMSSLWDNFSEECSGMCGV